MASAMRFGCDDCGGMWPTVEAIPARCLPYVDVIESGEGPMGYVWSGGREDDRVRLELRRDAVAS